MEQDRFIWCLLISTICHLGWAGGYFWQKPTLLPAPNTPVKIFEVSIIHDANQEKPKNPLQTAQKDHTETLKNTEIHDLQTTPKPQKPLWLQALNTPTILKKNEPLKPKPLRKRQITVSTAQSHEAIYLDSWRQHVEKHGNEIYPKLFKEQQVYGELTMLVAIDAAGNLKEANILQSSGVALLDEAALNIVKRAAPYQPLPPAITTEADVLEIIRTWKFEPK